MIFVFRFGRWYYEGSVLDFDRIMPGEVRAVEHRRWRGPVRYQFPWDSVLVVCPD